ncbi:hypothetical protein GCM10011325_26000 [Dyadobacter sediminis]|nr:hypothetical protein GCM10011325_26000 [Dyadobacter sediminis]
MSATIGSIWTDSPKTLPLIPAIIIISKKGSNNNANMTLSAYKPGLFNKPAPAGLSYLCDVNN